MTDVANIKEENLTIQISVETKKQLKMHCIEKGITLKELITKLVADYLNTK